MSSVVLSGDTSGTVTLTVPAVAGTNTVTVPASTGTVVVADGSGNVSITGNLSFNSGYGSSAVAYGCRAWITLDQTGTQTINGSKNVSSISDQGIGRTSVSFATAMPDANYCQVFGIGDYLITWSGNFALAATSNGYKTASSTYIDLSDSTVTQHDYHEVSIAIFR